MTRGRARELAEAVDVRWTEQEHVQKILASVAE